jgi:GT2 family glycosyltransferase
MTESAGPGKDALELSVILVNHNDRAHLEPCLTSLLRALSGLKAEVIVVDNRSTDGSQALVKSSFPRVRLIENDRNLGYPRGNNIGYSHSRGDCILFLNADTVVPEAAPAALLYEIKARPEVGAIGPALVHEDGSFQVSFGKKVDFFAELRQKFFLNPYHRIALRHSRRPREVGWLSGACLLARRSALEAAGLFDEDFFLYFEDIDLCRRIAAKGFKLLFLPSVRVTHVEGGATSAQRRQSRLEYRRSQLRFYRKHNSRPSLRLLRAFLRSSILVLGAWPVRDGEKKRFRQGLREILEARDAREVG